MTFWHWIAYLASLHGCTAITESTRSHVLYGGSCVQAWLISVHVPGVAWIIGP